MDFKLTTGSLMAALSLAIGACTSAALATRVDLGVYNNAGSASLAGIDLWVDIVDGPASTIDFVFHNDSAAPSFISSIYFESTPGFSGLSGGTVFAESAGVQFGSPATPPNPPPRGSAFGGSWTGNLLSLKAVSPSPTWGINHGGLETLTVRFDASGINAASVAAALLADPREFRIAQHVQGLAGGFSVWSITVPGPAPAALLAIAAAGVGRRRR